MNQIKDVILPKDNNKHVSSLNETCLTPSLIMEMHVPSKKSVPSCICVLGVSILHLFLRFYFIGLWNCSDSVVNFFCFPLYYQLFWWKNDYNFSFNNKNDIILSSELWTSLLTCKYCSILYKHLENKLIGRLYRETDTVLKKLLILIKYW